MRKWLFILALGARIAAVEWSGAGATTFGDAGDYMAASSSLCVQHAYPERANLPFFRAPGLPFFIAGVTACHPHSLRPIKYALAVCDAVTCVLIASIALLLFDRRVAWLAGLGAALHPIFIASVCDVRTETLFMMFMTLSIYELLRGRFGLSGVSMGLAALTRPTALLCAALFAAVPLVIPSVARDLGGRAVPRRAARAPRSLATLGMTSWFLLAFVLTLSPWILRNAIRFHEVILVNDAGGFNFWRGNHPGVMDITNEDDRAAYELEASRFELVTVAETSRLIASRAHSPAARSRQWVREGLRNIAHDPAATLLFTFQKAWLYWRPWLNPQEHGPLPVIVSGIGLLTLYILGGIGLVRYRDRRLAWAIAAFFVILCLAQLPYQITMRFRLPLVDPLMIVFAAATVAPIFEQRTRHADGDRNDRSAALQPL